jgi:hypothetical protein
MIQYGELACHHFDFDTVERPGYRKVSSNTEASLSFLMRASFALLIARRKEDCPSTKEEETIAGKRRYANCNKHG